MNVRRLTLGLVGPMVIALLAGCGSSNGYGAGNGTTSPGGADAVSVSNNAFTPVTLSVPVGTTVTWTWANGSVSHNVTFDDGTKSATQSSGTYSRTFTTAGTYPYHCTIHGTPMSGTITVQ